MSSDGRVDLLILWEHELRIAAKLLERFFALPEDASEGEAGAVAIDALRASRAALAGVEVEGKAIVLSSREFFPPASRKRRDPK